ncbi:MAG: DUF493 domain-containing protein [Victivallales bacterium]|nr:DUF493 domain-containing protein [Victivallales bacterium]
MSSSPLKIRGKELKFPVDWEFRIVVESDREGAVKTEIKSCLKKHQLDTDVHAGNRSGSGRFVTLKVATTLQDRKTLDTLSANFAQIEGVKFLL